MCQLCVPWLDLSFGFPMGNEDDDEDCEATAPGTDIVASFAA